MPRSDERDHRLPERLHRFRSRWGLTQEEAARRLGVDATTWNRWERAHARPRGLVRRELERFLQTDHPEQLALWPDQEI